jgi:hypothetical protein
MSDLRTQAPANLQEVGVSGVVRDVRFLPLVSINLGVLGRRPARATVSGIETVICCHSAIAWA